MITKSKKKKIVKLPRARSAAWRRRHYDKVSRKLRTAARLAARQAKAVAQTQAVVEVGA